MLKIKLSELHRMQKIVENVENMIYICNKLKLELDGIDQMNFVSYLENIAQEFYLLSDEIIERN